MIPAWVGAYVGLPYSDDDEPPACHCWGLVRRVYAVQLNLILPPYDDVSPQDLMKVARTMRRDSATWLPVANGRNPYDVVLMAGRETSRAPVHVGVMVSRSHMLHIEEHLASAVTAINHAMIASRVLATFRHGDLV